MTTIYYNPRCRKSREGLEIIESSGEPFRVVKYLEEPLSAEQLRKLLKKLGMVPAALVRTNEAIWKEKYRGKELSEDDLIEAMAGHPKLIERPIVEKGDRAVVGHPPEKIRRFLASF